MHRTIQILWVTLLFMVSPWANCSTAWTSTTRGYMAIHAFQAFPSDLRLALNKHRAAYRDAAMEPVAGTTSDHINDACRLIEQLERELSGEPDFDTVARKLGRLMGLTAALTDPFSTEQNAEALDYRQYVQSKLHKLVFAYHPLPLESVTKTDPCSVVQSLKQKSLRLRPLIDQDFRRFGHSSRFDDRSAAFGAASILFSDSCHEMSRLTILIWDRAQGDASTARILKQAGH